MRRILAAIVLAVLVLTLAFPSAAGAGKAVKPTGSMTLVMWVDNNGDGTPNWNDTITWDLTVANLPSSPYVSLSCSQAGVNVYNTQAGFAPTDPWPWTRYMVLRSQMWSGGAADCVANLYWWDGRRSRVLQTVTFGVAA